MKRTRRSNSVLVGCCGGLAAGLFVAAPLHADDLIHRYSFTTDASDSVGGANGTLMNAATVSGGQLQLNNPPFTGGKTPDTNGFLSLPASIMPTSGSVTIEEWFTFQGSGFFTESYAFSNNANDTNPPGANNGQYLMHAISAPQGGPNPSAGGNHIAQATNGFAGPPGETDAFSTTPGVGAGTPPGGFLDDGETFMCATVIDANAGTLSYYQFDLSQGGLGGLQQSITAVPLTAYSFTNAWLGRSPFLADNATSGAIDEFRIYTDAASAAQIAHDEAVGPNTVPEPTGILVTALGAMGLLFRRPRVSRR
jgi:hypothetical protein